MFLILELRNIDDYQYGDNCKLVFFSGDEPTEQRFVYCRKPVITPIDNNVITDNKGQYYLF